jgi:cytochrome b6-f complex iron-sulfur subunit
MKRREALNKIVLAGGTVLFVVPALISCSEDDAGDPGGDKDITINLDDSAYSALKNTGGSTVVSGIIVANTGNDTFVALSSICTHNACTVNYSAQNNNFPCPCHGSVFNADGSVANGPATQPLEEYTVTKEGNVLTIK